MLSLFALSFETMDLALVVLAAVAGTAMGWWLAVQFRKTTENQSTAQAQLVIERLKVLATNMAANVGEHTTRVQEINSDLQSKAGGDDESVVRSITKIIEANTQMQGKLKEAENRLKEQAVEIETQFTAARTDQLTGVANRRAFDDTLAECHKLWTKRGVPYSTLVIDVDHFKKFNDTYGHQAGDKVLVGVAGALSKAMRDKDIVARYGGEEFAVIFPQTKIEDAMPAAERARKAIEESVFEFEGQKLQVTASVGLAQIRGDDSAELLVKNADAGLYASKEAGRNCSHYHNGETFVPLTPRVKEAAANKKKSSTASTAAASFEDELRRRVAECQRFDVPLSVMRIEVDSLASVQKNHGPTGVRFVINAVSEILTATLREMDLATETRDGQISVMLPGSEVLDAANVAERIRATVAERAIGANPSGVDSAADHITVSLGLAQVVPCDDVAALLARADEALAASHAATGNCGHLHDGKVVQAIAASTPS